MALDLTKAPPEFELNGAIEISAEWNHSCTPQCPVPCAAKDSRLKPGIDTRMAVGADMWIDADGNPKF